MIVELRVPEDRPVDEVIALESGVVVSREVEKSF